MFKKINHIGIVVGDLEEAITVYSIGFGRKPDRMVDISDVGLKIAIFNIQGVEIELLCYTNTELPIIKALNGDRIGINHICYEVENFDNTMNILIQNGFQLIDGFPRIGVHGRIAFFVPPYSPDERIEILEVH